VIVLADSDLLVRIDPGHGGEILDLVELASGRQLLGRPPFGSLPPFGGDLDEERWTASYRGGWQTVLPNAGNPCELDGERHGFHGRASNDPWSVADAGPVSATLGWTGHGLEVSKHVALEDGAVAIRYRIRAVRDTALVALEHLTVGHELLEPDVAIDLPGGHAYELSETDGPTAPPEDAGRWPEIRLRDGSLERADTWSLAAPRSRFFVVAGIEAAWAAVRNPARGLGLACAWDADWFQHCWVWHENRVSGGPWREATEVLAIEPATVPHSLGVAAAAAEGHARRLKAGDEARPWIVARPFVSGEPVTGVDANGAVAT
jgi:hypothetical protein